MSKLFLVFVLTLVSSITLAQNRTSERLVRKNNNYYNFSAALERVKDGDIEMLKLAISKAKEKDKLTPHQKRVARLREKLNDATSSNN